MRNKIKRAVNTINVQKKCRCTCTYIHVHVHIYIVHVYTHKHHNYYYFHLVVPELYNLPVVDKSIATERRKALAVVTVVYPSFKAIVPLLTNGTI